jgi:HYDIN/CFA65/VesB family protein/beta-propeller repeat-containing protein
VLHHKLVVKVLLLVFCFATCFASSDKVQIPLTFEQNQGQMDGNARFIARTGRNTIFLTDTGAVFATSSAGKVHSVRMRFLGAKKSEPSGESATGGLVNYYRSSDSKKWLTRIPLFSAIRYSQLYPGIEGVFHGQLDRLEYDFEIAPGGSPNDIRFQLQGADQIAIAADGSLDIVSGPESWQMLPPIAYQMRGGQRISIPVSYRLLRDKSIVLKVNKFDHSSVLIIDPVVQYGTLLATNNSIHVAALQVDSSGDLIIAGDTFASNYPVVNGKGPSATGSNQIYVTKLNPAGDTILYSTYLPASGFSSARALGLDQSGNAYVAGIAGASDFPNTTNLASCSPQFCNAGFVAKLAPDGSLVYSSILASGQVLPRGIAIDAGGNAYVAGNATDNTLKTVNAFQPSYSGLICTSCSNAFFAKLDASGTSYVFASYFAGPATNSGGEMSAKGIALDSSGNIFIAGETQIGEPLVNPWESGGGLFISEFAPDGKTLLFSTGFGSSGADHLTGITVGADGTVYLVGSAGGQDFPYTLDAVAHPLGGASFPMFVTAIDPGLTKLTYSTYLGDGLDPVMALDSASHLHVGGLSVLNLLPRQNAVVSDVTSGGFVLELDAAGKPVNVSEFGGHFAAQVPTAIAVDSSGSVYIAGNLAQNTSFLTQPDDVIVGPIVGQNSGVNFGSFFAKINPANSPQISLAPVPPFLILRNAGSADLHVSSIVLAGNLAKYFGSCGTGSFTVPAGTSCVLTVTDANNLTASGTVTINSDAQPGSQTFTATLPGNGGNIIGPLILFQDVRFAYPPQLTGTTSDSVPMKLWNIGTANATVNSITANGSASETDDCNTQGGGTLAPGASCTVQVSLTPGGSQPQLHFVVNGSVHQDFVAFFVTPSAQQLQLSTTAIGFGRQEVGGVAIPRVVTATNTGGTAISAPVTSLQGDAEFVAAGNTCNTSLAPHQSCVVGVQFVPTISGTPSATLNIDGQQVSLFASAAIDSLVEITPLELDFFPTIINKPSTLPLTLTNTSNSAVGITGASFSLPDFSETDNCQGQVPANGSCTMNVSFSPQQLGSVKAKATISFSGNVFAQVLTLTGTGVTPMQVIPASLDFGSIAIGTTSASQGISLGNGMQGTPQGYTITTTGDFAITQNTCPNPMPGFTGCVVQVSFEPKIPGPAQGSFVVSYPGISEQSIIPLKGTGIGPAVALPPAVDFGNQVLSTNLQYNVSISNTGNANLTITNLSLSGLNAVDFSVAAGQCGTIAAGTSCNIKVGFTPSVAGQRVATLTIFDNALNSPQAVTISGTGVANLFALQIAPNSSSTATIRRGGTATFQLSVASTPGFTGTVQFTCTGAPQGANCSVQPFSVDFTGSTSSNLTVTVTTTAPTTAANFRAGTILFAAVFCIPFAFKRSRQRLAPLSLVMLLSFTLLFSITFLGCGGGGGGSGTPNVNATPAGTYTLTVTGTSGAQSQSVALKLIVQ